MAEDLIGEITYGELRCYNNEILINSATTYEEAVARVVRGDAEFVEFPLSALGNFAKELVDLITNTPAPNVNETILIPLPISTRNPIEDEVRSFIKQVFNNLDNDMILSIEKKIDQTIDYLTSHSLHIKSSLKQPNSATLTSMVSSIPNLSWHTDSTDTPYIRTLISLKGPGTKFCQLSNDEREEFYKLGNRIGILINFPKATTTQICTDERSVFQIKPYHGVVFLASASPNSSAIHTIPDYIGNRVTLMVNKYL